MFLNCNKNLIKLLRVESFRVSFVFCRKILNSGSRLVIFLRKCRLYSCCEDVGFDVIFFVRGVYWFVKGVFYV